MKFPKTESFSIKLTSFEQAIKFATTKRKYGGCFEQIDGEYIVYWLAKGDSRIANFAW